MISKLDALLIVLCHGTAALLKFDQTQKNTGKNKPSLVSAPIFRVADQSTVKYHRFENCNFYKVLYGEQLICPTNLIKIKICNMMVLR